MSVTPRFFPFRSPADLIESAFFVATISASPGAMPNWQMVSIFLPRAYSHPVELNALGKKIETICQFGIAPGEAEMVATKKADLIKSAADLKGKNLGVTDIGSGTHTITLALLGKAGYSGSDAHFVAVGAGNTFIAAIKNGTIDAGMTTEPTITRLLQSGDAKVLIDLRTPQSTRAAVGGDYPFIGIFAKNDGVNSH